MTSVEVYVLFFLSAAWLGSTQNARRYTNQWIAEIKGGEEAARRAAKSFGCTLKGPAPGFENFYLMTKDDLPQLSVMSKTISRGLTTKLNTLPQVLWAEQEKIVVRTKRGIIPKQSQKKEEKKRFKPFKNHGFGWVSINGLLQPSDDVILLQGEKLSTKPTNVKDLTTYNGPTESVGLLSNKTSAYKNMFNDPLWSKQWYFQDYRTKNSPVMDFNIVPVWKKGITGKGVTVAVVDDGIQNGHPDLVGNYDYNLSYDLVNDKNGSEPDEGEFHGTMCAGEIGMVANNNKCGVGAAYNAKILGVKLLGVTHTDFMEARALTYNLDKIDIYTNSWGPMDDGLTMEPIDRVTLLAFKKGVTQGRGGKGAIYTFAAGNGRGMYDNCAYDAFINSAYTIPITSVSQNGKTTFYSERCSAVFAGAYSGGGEEDESVTTIALNSRCTIEFTGTSAATPLAAGIIALVLSANPNLTERDVKHIIAMGAEVAPVANNPGIWYKNGRGFWVSNDFGFGLLNAENMVNLAKRWINVPPKNECVVVINLANPVNITAGQTKPVKFTTRACQDTPDAVNYLEQIELASRIQYSYRGALAINLKSPSGTKTALLETRQYDNSSDFLSDWSIKSVHNWGEDPKGTWEIEVKTSDFSEALGASGFIQNFTMRFHGTLKKPVHYGLTPRSYSAFRLPDGQTSLS